MAKDLRLKRFGLLWHGRTDGRGVDRTVCIMAPENGASRRVAEKCGYSLKGNLRFGERPTLLLQRERGRQG
ncbi:hypothetical protein AA18890_3160 [Komagataeibacter europaeus LMG 18890]|nr:hypothetical protein AA18890_3160 [Komagataeibacter europaeus LMG 18890]